MDAKQSMELETWKQRRQRLDALIRDDPSQQRRDPAEPEKIMDHQLYLAAKEGDVDKFIKALEDHCAKEGVSLPVVLDLRSPSESTLLHAAAGIFKRVIFMLKFTRHQWKTENDDIIRAIIDFFPEDQISGANSRGETPLLLAARAGKTSAVELLLPQGNPRITDCTGNSALHEAVKNRHYEVIRRLVNADPHPLYHQNGESKSPWYLAVETGDLEVLKCLLEVPNEGEDERRSQTPWDFGMPPAHVAVMHQKLDMLTEMWEKKPWLFQLRDAEYGTPLHFAAYANYLDGVKFMTEKFPKSVLKQDSTMLGQDRTEGYLPIHVACMMDHVGIVKELLQQWPDPAEFPSRLLQNILHVSARHGSISTIKYILKNPKFGHLINARDFEMNTPLHLAALHWQPSVLLLLARDSRVDLKLVDMNNMTALDVVDFFVYSLTLYLQRLTRIILQSAGTPRSGELAIWKPNSRIPRKELEPPDLDIVKEEVNTSMVVATLVAAMTFASGAGIAIFLHKAMYNVFVISNSIAMYSSIIAIVIFLWTQIHFPHAMRNALLKARLPLLVALAAMALAFMAGVYVTVTKLAWLAIVVLVLGSVALFIILSLYLLLYIPLGSNNRLIRRFTDLIILIIYWVSVGKEGTKGAFNS
ncbi:hypothetical protein EUGRSUZ_E02709 [Eucalyptus grandis]|uniref:PGG domain-containing protein n=2 Tax=Eucalyptus grandis TaxID=71139 RepID=A0A059C7B3_EUCGR|nr:hypothetical protein EUGRSUZ_E02709 [Eucalyptus grandis]